MLKYIDSVGDATCENMSQRGEGHSIDLKVHSKDMRIQISKAYKNHPSPSVLHLLWI